LAQSFAASFTSDTCAEALIDATEKEANMINFNVLDMVAISVN
jgi:hypothetical protein